jgi:hypothetical protein
MVVVGGKGGDIVRRKTILLLVALALITVMVAAAPAYARQLPDAACNPGQALGHSPKVDNGCNVLP